MISFILQTRVVSLGNHQRLQAACKTLAGYSAVTVVMCARNRTIRATPLPRSSFPGRLLFIATLDGEWKNVQRLAAYQIVLQRMSWWRHQARNETVMKSRPCTVCIPTVTPALTWAHACAPSLVHSCLAAAMPHLCERRDAVRNPTFPHS